MDKKIKIQEQFVAWVEMGNRRSYRTIAEAVGVSVEDVAKHAKEFGWKEKLAQLVVTSHVLEIMPDLKGTTICDVYTIPCDNGNVGLFAVLPDQKTADVVAEIVKLLRSKK